MTSHQRVEITITKSLKSPKESFVHRAAKCICLVQNINTACCCSFSGPLVSEEGGGVLLSLTPCFGGDWQDELDFVGKHVSHNRPNSDLISLAAGRHAMWSRSSTIPHIPHSSLAKMLRVCVTIEIKGLQTSIQVVYRVNYWWWKLDKKKIGNATD